MPAYCVRLALLLALSAPAAHAREVYKCTTLHGETAYQDMSCVADTTQTMLRVADESARAPPPQTAAAPAPERPKAPPPEPRRARTALTPLWLCTNAENGSHYTSRNGPRPPRLVPLGTLG